jgi:APA family basic amino acid/polyamine antiporter
MVVIGVMIGSGIFIVSADMSRLINSPGWMLMAWALTGVLTIAAALSYGELASMLPHAGGMYVYLREAFSPLWGFLYGWTFFTVIQTGTIAAVSVAFARFFSIVFPPVAEDRYLIRPIHLSAGYAISLSTAQLVAIAVIVLLTFANTRGLEYGKIVQNLFTSAKTVALAALILAGLFLGWNSAAVHVNFTGMFRLGSYDASLGVAAGGFFGLMVALCVAQSGSMFSADSWHDITIIAGEVRNPARNVPLAMAFGCSAVILLYILANVAYLVVDEVGMEAMNREDASLFFRLVSYRYRRGSTAITTNKSVKDWPGILAGDEAMTAAVLDRLLHKSVVWNIRGRSYRLQELEKVLK